MNETKDVFRQFSTSTKASILGDIRSFGEPQCVQAENTLTSGSATPGVLDAHQGEWESWRPGRDDIISANSSGVQDGQICIVVFGEKNNAPGAECSQAELITVPETQAGDTRRFGPRGLEAGSR